ncbi:hypothetical protein D3C77_696620 [compost metagenome]
MTLLKAMVQPLHEAPACGLIERMHLCFAQPSVLIQPLGRRRRARDCVPLDGLSKLPGMRVVRQVPGLDRTQHCVPLRTLITT